MKLWKWLDGWKSNIGGWLMFAAAFSDQVLCGIWGFDPEVIRPYQQTLLWFAGTVWGVGQFDKARKARVKK